jgi:mono/diheme cytochrome c family protein
MMVALTALLVLAFAVPGFGQQPPAPKPAIRNVPAMQTDAASGSEMFKSYCAACHGATGKGNGPAAPALKKSPADLTQLSARNNGKFPTEHFVDMLQHGPITAHGSPDMPTWGPIFNALNNPLVTKLRIENLSTYVEGLQGK